MFRYNNKYLEKPFIIRLGLLTVMLMLIGCGGGGGGAKPLVPDDPNDPNDPNSPAENKIPAAVISAPTGTQFNEGENVEFTGSATDEEDGTLDGASLVWTSSIDGPIGTGSALTIGTLTAGDHEITLTATDSQGGIHITPPAPVRIAQTRFIKMGTQTTGVSDATNAFDGDNETASTIMAPDTEFIHFKSFIGGSDTFTFNIKVGASTPGSVLAVQGLFAGDNTWRAAGGDIALNSDSTATVRIANPQDFKDAQGYINLRVRWEGGGSGDSLAIYEVWRIDAIHSGSLTTIPGVDNATAAFDGNATTPAVITAPWDAATGAPFLNLRAYVGSGGASNTFSFTFSHNAIGVDQLVSIDVQDLASSTPGGWTAVAGFKLDVTTTRRVTVSDVQKYLDADGYVSLRARWVGGGTPNQLQIFEISRIDPFFIGPKTTLGDDWQYFEQNAVDGNAQTSAGLYYSWGELGRYEFIHVQAYAGDKSKYALSIEALLEAAPPAEASEANLILEGETQPDTWAIVHQFTINDVLKKEAVDLPNARLYINAGGYLSLRVRWEANTVQHDAKIHEISLN